MGLRPAPGTPAHTPNIFRPEAYGAKRDGVTDDTAAIQAAIDAAVAAAIASQSYYAEVQFTTGVYKVSSPCVTGARKGNAQITLPLVAGTAHKVTLVLKGTENSSALPLWAQTTAQKCGVVIQSTLTGGLWDATNGPPSILGGPTPEQGYSALNFNNMLVVMDGLSFVSPFNSAMCGIDLRGTAQCHIGTLSCFADFTPPTAALPTLGMYQSYLFANALLMPTTGNNDNCVVENFSCENWMSAIAPGEHTHVRTMRAVYCRFGVNVWVPAPHGCTIDHLSTEWCRSHIHAEPQSGGSGFFHMNVGLWDIEDGNPPLETIFHIFDPNVKLRGDINFMINGDPTPTDPLKVCDDPGGSALNQGNIKARIRNQLRSPGNFTAPTVPASGTAFVNKLWRSAAVTVTGGTVSAIAVDGVATDLTSGTVIVPPGKKITLTYTVAPTWKWTLL